MIDCQPLKLLDILAILGPFDIFFVFAVLYGFSIIYMFKILFILSCFESYDDNGSFYDG